MPTSPEAGNNFPWQLEVLLVAGGCLILVAVLLVIADAIGRAVERWLDRRALDELWEDEPRTHGRGCPCTPCQREDWDAIDAGLRLVRR